MTSSVIGGPLDTHSTTVMALGDDETKKNKIPILEIAKISLGAGAIVAGTGYAYIKLRAIDVSRTDARVVITGAFIEMAIKMAAGLTIAYFLNRKKT